MSQIWHSANFFLKYFVECPWHGTRQRFFFKKYLFLEKILCRVPLARHSAKIYFFLNVFAEFPVKALGKEKFFLKKIQTLFAECLIRGTRQRPSLPSAMPRHSAKFFLVFCFWPPNFLCSPLKAPGTPS